MGYRSAINIFLVVLPPKKHLFDIIVPHFFSYSNTGIESDVLHLVRNHSIHGMLSEKNHHLVVEPLDNTLL